jgi:hypothetical protein
MLAGPSARTELFTSRPALRVGVQYVRPFQIGVGLNGENWPR